MASPIPTPRLQPVKWSIKNNDSLCGRTSPPPRLPSSSLRGDSNFVPRSAIDHTLLPRQPLSHGNSPGLGKDARSARTKCAIVSASSKEQLVAPLSLLPPIASARPDSRSTPSFDFDSSGSEDNEDEGEEYDELLPSSPEPELEDSEGPSFRNRTHRISGIEACINPGITEEGAMDAVFAHRERERKQVFSESLARDTRGLEDYGSIEIRMGSMADRDGLPSLTKVSPSLSSSSLSSTTLVNDSYDTHSRCGLPDMHHKPGKRIHASPIRSSPPFMNHHHHHDHSQSDYEDEDKMDVLPDKSFSGMDIDGRSNIKVYTTRPVGAGERAAGAVRMKGGRLGKLKMRGLHEYDDDDEENYGAYPPASGRSHPQYLAYGLGEQHMVRPGKWLTALPSLP